MFCGSIRLDAYSPDVRRQIHRHFERRVRSLPQYVIKGGLVVVSGGCNGVWRLVAAGGSPRRYLRHQAAETQRRSICASCAGVSHSQPEGGSPERPVVGSFPSPNCGLIPMGLPGSMHVKLWRTGMQGHTPINGFPPVARIGDVATLPTSPLVANDRVALPLHPRVCSGVGLFADIAQNRSKARLDSRQDPAVASAWPEALPDGPTARMIFAWESSLGGIIESGCYAHLHA
jgi:hypothetical protein